MKQANYGKRAFTWAEVDAIRARYAGGESQGALCREFGVSLGTIGRIVRGETYHPDSRTRVQPELVRRMDMDPDNPEHMRRLGERLAALTGTGTGEVPMVTPETRPPVTDEQARLYYRLFQEWPEGYTPPGDDSNNQLEVGGEPA